MQKRFIGGVAILVTVLAVVLSGCGAATMSASWAGTAFSHQEPDDGWTVSAGTLKGSATRNVTFSADNLAALQVTNVNSGGTVSFTITQGDTEKAFDINGNFSGAIDMGGFAPGDISLRLDFEEAEGVELNMKW